MHLTSSALPRIKLEFSQPYSILRPYRYLPRSRHRFRPWPFLLGLMGTIRVTLRVCACLMPRLMSRGRGSVAKHPSVSASRLEQRVKVQKIGRIRRWNQADKMPQQNPESPSRARRVKRFPDFCRFGSRFDVFVWTRTECNRSHFLPLVGAVVWGELICSKHWGFKLRHGICYFFVQTKKLAYSFSSMTPHDRIRHTPIHKCAVFIVWNPALCIWRLISLSNTIFPHKHAVQHCTYQNCMRDGRILYEWALHDLYLCGHASECKSDQWLWSYSTSKN